MERNGHDTLQTLPLDSILEHAKACMCVRIPDPHHIVHGAGGEETGGGEKGRRISVCGLGSHRNEGVEIGVGGGRGVGSGEECHGKDAVLVAGEEGMGMGEVDAAEGAKEDASVGRSREGRAVGGNGEGVRGLPVDGGAAGTKGDRTSYERIYLYSYTR